jgi:hypothetical protein
MKVINNIERRCKKMILKRCKYAIVEASFSTSINEEGRIEEYDKIDGIPHSFRGIWFGMPVCGLAEDMDTQFKKREGFFYCDEKKCSECIYYEPLNNGKQVLQTKRDTIGSKLRHEVFKRDGYKCKECGTTNKEGILHCDHITPISQGGTDELSNLQTLCNKCNLAKSNKKWEKKEDVTRG